MTTIIAITGIEQEAITILIPACVSSENGRSLSKIIYVYILDNNRYHAEIHY